MFPRKSHTKNAVNSNPSPPAMLMIRYEQTIIIRLDIAREPKGMYCFFLMDNK